MKRGEVGLQVVEVGRVAANVIRQVFDNVLRHSTLVNPGIELLDVLVVEALQSFHRLQRFTVVSHIVQGLKRVLAHVVLFDSEPEQGADGGRLTSHVIATAVVDTLVVGVSQDVLDSFDVLERVVEYVPEVDLDSQREQVKRCELAMKLGSVLTQEGRCPLDSLRLQDVVGVA